jgi:hypothetical protein
MLFANMGLGLTKRRELVVAAAAIGKPQRVSFCSKKNFPKTSAVINIIVVCFTSSSK